MRIYIVKQYDECDCDCGVYTIDSVWVDEAKAEARASERYGAFVDYYDTEDAK